MDENEGSPSALAHELRERFHADHRGCGPMGGVCPFPNMQAEDIDEVLNAVGYFELRARDEAAKTVVQWYRTSNAVRDRIVSDYGDAALDELARAHQDGGQDR